MGYYRRHGMALATVGGAWFFFVHFGFWKIAPYI
jgi:hypothetical protein